MQQELTNKIRSISISIENNEISKKLNQLGVKDMLNISRQQKQEMGDNLVSESHLFTTIELTETELQYYTKQKRNILKYHWSP